MLPTNEIIIDLYIERAIDILRLEAGTSKKVLALLEDLERELITQIVVIDPTGVSHDRYQRERLLKLFKAITEAIRAGYRDVNSLMVAELLELADIEAAWTMRTFNTAIGFEYVDSTLSRGFLKTLVSDVLVQGAPTRNCWSRQAAGLVERFADQMRRGVALGETNSQLVERIRGTKTQRGLMDISEVSATRLVRASVQTVANVSREAMYADNADIIASLQWHATLDLQTSEWCLVRDGKHYSVGEDHKPLDSDVPWLEGPGKLHWGCRSTSIPVLKTWRELGVNIDEIPQTTRASMDGQVPASTTFESWLKKQSKERQNAVLGAGKAELWRAGKITLRDLLDQNGRPLTTEELRKKAAR